jgi:hypothetical protein
MEGEDGGHPADDPAGLDDPEEIPASNTAPRTSSYLALFLGLLTGAVLLAVTTVGVPGTTVRVSGVAAMVTSALATLMAAGALLALRSALAARKDRI